MQNPGATWEGLLNTSICACGSVVELGHEFCFNCGRALGTAIDSSFEGEDAPTQLQPPEFARQAAKADVWTRGPVTPGTLPVPPASSGFRKGLLLGAGLSALAFGSVALVGAGFLLGTRSVAGTSVATVAGARSLAEATPVVAEPKPISIAVVEPKPAPVVVETKPLPVVVETKPVPVVVETKPVPVVVDAKPLPVVAEAKPVVREVKPVVVAKPAVVAKPVVVARTVAPKPVAAPVVARPSPVVAEKPAPARPNREELAALAASVRQKVAPPAPAKPADKSPVAAYNWDDQPASAPAAAASWAPVELDADVLDAPKAAPAGEPELDDILGAPAASAKSPSPSAKAPARASSARSASARTIHAQKGDVTIALNASIALTRTNGKPLVGTLIDVDGGFVAVKTAGAQVKIAESDVIEAATY